jgi:hypothetical protein
VTTTNERTNHEYDDDDRACDDHEGAV